MALPAAAGLCRLHAAAAALLPGLATAVARGGVAAGELCAPSSSGRCSTPLVQLRQQHAERRPYGIVPPELLAELANIDGQLRRASHLDGRQRLELSSPQLPLALPQHTVEPELPQLVAHVRPGSGKTFTKWLRKAGRVPVRVHSLPGQQHLLGHVAEVEAQKLVRAYGRNGCQARVLALQLVAPGPGPGRDPGPVPLGTLRVKPTAVRLNSASQRLEDLDLIYCPQDRVVIVDVPVRLVNDDAAPGLKKGGWLSITKRVVRYKALGSSVPPYIEVNVRNLDLEQAVLVRDMPVPPGTKLYEKDYDATVVLCTTDVGKD